MHVQQLLSSVELSRFSPMPNPSAPEIQLLRAASNARPTNLMASLDLTYVHHVVGFGWNSLSLLTRRGRTAS
jgi:hypothetical protein